MVLRRCRQSIKAFIYREKFNNMRYIDPIEYHSIFIAWATFFSVMEYKTKKMWMYIVPAVMIIIGICGILISVISAVHYIQNFDLTLVTENINYVMYMGYQVFGIYTILGGRNEYRNLLQSLKNDFDYISTKKQKYRYNLSPVYTNQSTAEHGASSHYEKGKALVQHLAKCRLADYTRDREGSKFLENQRLTFIGECLVIFVLGFYACVMGTVACINVVVIIARNPGAKRPLPFSFQLFDYDMHASPLYEIIFITSMVLMSSFSFVFTFMHQSHIIWVREAILKADFVKWNLQDLLVDVQPAKNNTEKEFYAMLIRHRMKEIVEMHQTMLNLIEDYAAVYAKCSYFEQIFASPLICMTAYCVVEKFEATGEIQLLVFMQFLAGVMTVFWPNFLCTHLLEKVRSISDECYEVSFWNAGPVIRPYLILIMQRSMRPLPFKAPGFGEISLQTYATIITRAYSGFNMLRQLDLGFEK